jgi:glutamate-5-semialdehyde dehydrogenase
MNTVAVTDRLLNQAQAARAAARRLARLSTPIRNQALWNIAQALEQDQADVLAANGRDYQAGQADGMDDSLLDRLLLTPERLSALARDVRGIANLPDPVGEVMESSTLDNGLRLEKRRVPLGVIASIYESRPNVTVDIAALCIKSGNACILRGGKESLNSNSALVTLIHRAIAAAGVPEEAVQFVDNPDRALVNALLKMKEYISLLIPRGGAGLIRFVSQHATMPVVTGGIGVCHTYVDRAADLDMAVRIVLNAKVQRPSVCNALDSVLVHTEVAPRFLPPMAAQLGQAGVELHCDHRALSILGPQPGARVIPATADDWGREFLSLTAAVRVVDSLDDALAHIETYGSGHSDAIITGDEAAADRFLDEVDSCAVYVNASTRFTDGAQFGLGAEVGISTQKFHARGPMGLRELTTYKWLVRGNGQIRA